MKKRVRTIYCLLILMLLAGSATAQTTVDRMLATVGDGVRTELITHSDVLWQLALQPDVRLDAVSTNSREYEETLNLLIEQRLIALEAERLPTAAPTEADVTAEIRRLVSAFGSAAIFENRLRRVGFESTDDPNFRRIVEQRLAIENYLNFRFRSFVVVTPADEQKYYNEVFVPNFRRRNPNTIVPLLETVRAQINSEVTEQRVAAEIERFLTEARERAVVTILT